MSETAQVITSYTHSYYKRVKSFPGNIDPGGVDLLSHSLQSDNSLYCDTSLCIACCACLPPNFRWCVNCEHCWLSTHEVIRRPQWLSMRHLTVMSQSQFFAYVSLYSQPRPEPSARQLPRPRSVLSVTATRLLPTLVLLRS